MDDSVNLLKEVDRILTRITIKYPDAWGLIWRQHKHIRFVIDHPEGKDSPEKTLLKSRNWLIAAMVNHPMFDEDFRPVANDITDYFKDQQKI